MIYLYSGTPGSGKSLHQAKDIYNWLRHGRCCICNYDIDVSKIKKANGQFIYLDNEHLKPELLLLSLYLYLIHTLYTHHVLLSSNFIIFHKSFMGGRCSDTSPPT